MIGLLEWVVKHRRGLVTGFTIGLEIGAVILAAKQAPKAREHIDEMYILVNDAENEGSEEYVERELTPKEVFLACWKDYIPVAALVVAGAGLSIWSCVDSGNQLAAAITAATSSADALVNTREGIKEIFGESGVQKLNDREAKQVMDKIKYSDANIIETGEGDILYAIPEIGQLFRASAPWIEACMVTLTNRARESDGASIIDWVDIVLKERVDVKGPLGECGWSPEMVHYRQILPTYGYSEAPTGETAKTVKFSIDPRYGYQWNTRYDFPPSVI